MNRILHVTPHMGGGIGRVLSNIIDAFHARGHFQHQICCLEHANESASAWAEKTGVPMSDRMAADTTNLYEKLRQSDIVHVHWWNHPLIYNFLADPLLPEMRTAIWSHVNGHHAPHVFTPSLIDWPDAFVLASPYSREAPCISELPEIIRESKIKLVQSCAGVGHVNHVNSKPHNGFHIGYIGTVDYCKLHRRFVEMSLSVDIPDAKYIIFGEDVGGIVEKDVIAAGGSTKFEFRGWTEDISAAFNEFDVLGYPLDGDNYGTGEQVLIEAMAAAVVPLVIDTGLEKHIVENGETGIVVNSIEEYVAALEYLYHHPKQRKKLGRQARQTALQKYDIGQTVGAWHAIYEELGSLEKRKHHFKGVAFNGGQSDKAVNIYLQSLGKSHAATLYAGLLQSDTDLNLRRFKAGIKNLQPIFHSPTRGSVYHYQSFFSDSPGLNRLCNIMLQNRDKKHPSPDPILST